MKPAKFSVKPIACFALAAVLIGCAAPGPTVVITPSRPTPRPTFPFPPGTPVPVTSAEGVLIENEAGPLYVILSTVDEHGLAGEPTLDLMSRPDPADTTSVGSVPSGAFAQVLEIRRLPPDYLRSFYRVKVHHGASRLLEGWVSDWHARRIVFVVEFDERGCACPFPVQVWADAQLTQPAGLMPNRSPLRLLALADKVAVIVCQHGHAEFGCPRQNGLVQGAVESVLDGAATIVAALAQSRDNARGEIGIHVERDEEMLVAHWLLPRISAWWAF